MKRKGLKEGECSPHVTAPAGAWDPHAASCDGCWAAPSECRRKDIEKPENQAVDAISRGGRWLHIPRGAIHEKGALSYLGDWEPWGCCTHQPQHLWMAAADGRGASPGSHSQHNLGSLPHHRGLLSLGISWGTAESSAGDLALK